MTETEKERNRLLAALKTIIDGRKPCANSAEILVTLDGVVAAVLLACLGKDPRAAAGMLNEGLVPAVEERLVLFASRTPEAQ